MYPDQRRSSTSSNSSATNLQSNIKEEPQSPSASSLSQSISNPGSQNQSHRDRDRDRDRDRNDHQQQAKNLKSTSQPSQLKVSNKDGKSDDKDANIKVKQEGQKPTMETQGPPPPPTSQYYIHPSYMGAAPFGFESAHPMYRNMNMMVPAAAYGASPYHMPMSRFHAPEDLSRNTSSKALDMLQHHANQYYNPHKIHELSERALKSPTSNVKTTVSSPNVTQPQQQTSSQMTTSNQNAQVSASSHVPSGNSLNLQPPTSTTQMQPGSGGSSTGQTKTSGGNSISGEKLNISGNSGPDMLTNKDGTNTGRSPPPQRHVHTHHHTHVGLGYPMYPAPYGRKYY